MPSTRDKIALAFAKASGTYDQYASVQRSLAVEMIRVLRRWHPGKFNRVLELGCGTGLYSLRLCRAWPGAEFDFTDLSRQMLDVCRRKITAACPSCRARYRIQDAARPLERELKGPYDLVTSSAALQWTGHPGESILRASRGLRSGGTIFHAFASSRNFTELDRVLNLWLESRSRPAVHLPAASFPAECLPGGFDRSLFREIRTAEFGVRRVHASLLEMLRVIRRTGEYGAGLPRGTLASPRVIRELDALFRREYGAVVATRHFFILYAEKK